MKAIHKKTQEVYYIKDVATNTTNAQDGDIMVIYYNGRGQMFVREQFEFFEKFDVGVDCKTDLLDTCIRAIADENRRYTEDNAKKTANAKMKMKMSKETEAAFDAINLPPETPLIVYNQTEYLHKFKEERFQTCFIKDISPKIVKYCFDNFVARKDLPSWDSFSELRIELARRKIEKLPGDLYIYCHFLLCYKRISETLPAYIETVYQLPTRVGEELIKELEKQSKEKSS